MISIENCKKIDLNLHRSEVLNLSQAHPGMSIECEQGILWVTRSGDATDYTLKAGERYVAPDSSPLLVQAVRDAVLNLTDQDALRPQAA